MISLMSSPFLILAYYLFVPIHDPLGEVQAHQNFLKNRQITCRIYISEQGINGQLSGEREDTEAYMEWMQANPLFAKVSFKIHGYHENVFPRQTVKYRQKLVALDEEIDFAQTGEHVSPERWKALLTSETSPLLLDIRNDYEWSVGHFKGAISPPCSTFREFKQYMETLTEQVNPQETPVMMYCTGGIRCELFSSLLLKKGFKKVYQLEGGIINYGLKQGSDHWLGKLFVFDDRLVVPISDQPTPVVGQCEHCQTPNESYYNCANMDCNHLFLCCPSCLEQLDGCCSSPCQTAPRRRPYQQQNAHKPFRKWFHYFKDKCLITNS